MKVRNKFTNKDMISRFEIEQEIIEYINKLESNLNTRIQEVKAMNEQLVSKNKEIEALKEEVKVSPKVSGRKDKFDTAQKKQIRELRTKGVSIKGLAEHYKCSTTLIHKICKDIEVDLRKQERGVKITTLIKTQNQQG